jgi:hypothetical protein
LEKVSVANVTELLTVEKSDLEAPAGRLSESRLDQALEGIRLVMEKI